MSGAHAHPAVLVLDCGATNVRALAIDVTGKLLHMEARPNAPVLQAKGKPWLVWDLEGIWAKLIVCARNTVSVVGRESIVALVVTSFSDDGAPIDRKGKLLYPVISWQCRRTIGMAESLDAILALTEIYAITGQPALSQHTLLRLLWLRQHAPGVLEKAYKYLMFPGLITYRLTEECTNDPTTADSMMLLDIRKRRYSERILTSLDIDSGLFGTMVEPGTVIAPLGDKMADELGLRRGIPIDAGGHDTQFAVFGSGCKSGEMVLSSGTWEILMLRSAACKTDAAAFKTDLNNECDPVPGLFDLGLQWIGSGAIEWISRIFYPQVSERAHVYRTMIGEAQEVPAGANGVMVLPSLLPMPGVFKRGTTGGTILGCTLQTQRGEIYRALLEGLAFQLRSAVETLQDLLDMRPSCLTVVGGGAKNALWNRIRADVTNLPIRLTCQAENTGLGAAIFGFIGAGVYADVDEAYSQITFFKDSIEPGSDSKRYDYLFVKYNALGSTLDAFQSQ